MLSERLLQLMNEQINHEFYSAYLYLSMASYYHALGLDGFANWMRVQCLEEQVHAMKFFDFINDMNGRIVLKGISDPPVEWDSPRAPFEAALLHERKVTGLINNLVNVSLEEHDHASNNFLQWFISEQVEEESSVQAVLDKFNLMGDAPGGMYMIDKDLATRTFIYPPAQAKA